MSSEAAVQAVRFDDHRHCIPTEIALDAPFDLAIPRVHRLFLRRNRIDIWTGHRWWDVYARLPEAGNEFVDDIRNTLGFHMLQKILQNILERILVFLSLERVITPASASRIGVALQNTLLFGIIVFHLAFRTMRWTCLSAVRSFNIKNF